MPKKLKLKKARQNKPKLKLKLPSFVSPSLPQTITNVVGEFGAKPLVEKIKDKRQEKRLSKTLIAPLTPEGEQKVKQVAQEETAIQEAKTAPSARSTGTPLADAYATNDFFKPDVSGKVRVRDVVREMPDAFINTAADIGQSIARNIGLTAKIVSTGDFGAELKPQTRLEEIITGKERGETFDLIDEGRDIASILGEEFASEMPEAGLFIIGAISAGSDALGFGAEKQALKQLAKETAPDVIKQLIKKQYPKISDDVLEVASKRIAKQTTEAAVEKELVKAASADYLKKTVSTKKPAVKEIVSTIPKSKVKPIVRKTTGQVRDDDIRFISQQLKRDARVSREAKRAVVKRERFKSKRALDDEIRRLRSEFKAKETSLNNMRKSATQFINKNIPADKRGRLLTSAANAKTKGQINSIFSRAVPQARKFAVQAKETAELGKQRSVLSFLRKVGELDQAVINDVKQTVGLDKPLRQASKEELDVFGKELKERISFKAERGLIKKPKLSDNAPEFNDDFYARNIEQIKADKKFIPRAKRAIGDTRRAIGSGVDTVLGTISSRLGAINEGLRARLRKFEFDLGQSKLRDEKRAENFLRGFNKIKGDDKIALELAMKNGDAKKIKELVAKHKLTREYAQIRKMFDDIYRRSKEVGMDVEYRKDFIPRVVEDSNGLMRYVQETDDWGAINKAIQNKENELGRYLKNSEKAQLTNNLLRGYSGGNVTLSTPGQLKARSIDVLNGEMDKFYADVPTSITRYIEDVNNSIEARRFFGKELKVKNGDFLMNDSIGAVTTKLVADGKIKPSEEALVKQILSARFDEVGPGKLITGIKNASYIDTMGSPLSAVTQLGDLAFAIYKNPVDTLPEFAKSVFGRAKITKKDLGIDRIAEEFSRGDWLSRQVSNVFKITGLTSMDRIGKETLINSSFKKFQRQAKKNDPRLIEKLRTMFGRTGVADVVDDLAKGRVTENTKMVVFNELLDVQPIALSEMPEAYLKGGNGRIFYMLKTFGIKMLDVFRRESFAKMADANKLYKQADSAADAATKARLEKKARKLAVEGAANLFKLGVAVIALNGTADVAKDAIMGREIDLGDTVTDNILKIFFFNKFLAKKAENEGIGTTIGGMVLPPTRFIDSAYKDITKGRGINEGETVRSIPVGGNLYYWWFGKGSDRNDGKGVKLNPKLKIKSKPKLKTKKLRLKS
jgi:hypothetical protein